MKNPESTEFDSMRMKIIETRKLTWNKDNETNV